ncbi:anti-sigma factor [Devosia sp. 2618]|uniref:anti-sigma factor family protein n=1 Tax=Devosia sp. 2618 TaxID=3156454 RepID=UPI0033980BB5
MPHSEPVDPVELAAYVDDQLDVSRRIAVEHWLSQNPSAAADVMADLRLRDELRFVRGTDEVPASLATDVLARRLNGRLQRDRIFRNLRPLMAASLLLTIGWLAHAQIGNTPALASSTVPEYVTAAVVAHHTTELRALMHSQPQATEFDPVELLARTDIMMPVLPVGWTITDVQVYPSEFGPSIEVAINTNDLGPISIFAARPGQSLTTSPMTLPVEDTTTAYWQLGPTAYALVSSAAPADVAKTATALFESMR